MCLRLLSPIRWPLQSKRHIPPSHRKIYPFSRLDRMNCEPCHPRGLLSITPHFLTCSKLLPGGIRPPAPWISFWVNWVYTQPGYPQLRTCKNNCVFSYFFYATFFFCDYTFSYCMKPSGMCLHIYTFPSSAFLKYQTRGFYCTLLTFERVNFAKFHFHLSFLVFFRKILDWAPIFP